MGGRQFCCNSGERGPGWRGCGAYRLVSCRNSPELKILAAVLARCLPRLEGPEQLA